MKIIIFVLAAISAVSATADEHYNFPYATAENFEKYDFDLNEKNLPITTKDEEIYIPGNYPPCPQTESTNEKAINANIDKNSVEIVRARPAKNNDKDIKRKPNDLLIEYLLVILVGIVIGLMIPFPQREKR